MRIGNTLFKLTLKHWNSHSKSYVERRFGCLSLSRSHLPQTAPHCALPHHHPTTPNDEQCLLEHPQNLHWLKLLKLRLLRKRHMSARRQRAVKSLFRRTTKLEEVDQAKVGSPCYSATMHRMAIISNQRRVNRRCLPFGSISLPIARVPQCLTALSFVFWVCMWSPLI